MVKEIFEGFRKSRTFQFRSMVTLLAILISGLILNTVVPVLAEDERIDVGIDPVIFIVVEDDLRKFTTNEIPSHQVGLFPNESNPNTISSQKGSYQMPENGEKTGSFTSVGLWPMGISIGGVLLDPVADEYYNDDKSSGWTYNGVSDLVDLGMDFNEAHVQPSGAYHYHGLPTSLVEEQDSKKHSEILGYAADGFPIYGRYGYAKALDSRSKIKNLQPSYTLKSGERESDPGGAYDGTYTQDYEYSEGLGDLDEANGRFGKTPDFPNGTYAYFLTDEYPQIPRYLAGTVDTSFSE